MTGDWFTRGDDEAVQWSGQPRRTVVAPMALAALAVAAVAAVYEPLLGAVAFVAGVAVVGWTYLRLSNTEYVLTDAAVYRKQGVLGEHVTRVDLARVQNTDLKKGVLGNQFGFGDVNVDTAGSAGVELSIDRVSDPEDVRELLLDLTKRASGDAVAGVGSAASVEQALEEARKLRAVAESLERRFTGGRQ